MKNENNSIWHAFRKRNRIPQKIPTILNHIHFYCSKTNASVFFPIGLKNKENLQTTCKSSKTCSYSFFGILARYLHNIHSDSINNSLLLFRIAAKVEHFHSATQYCLC